MSPKPASAKCPVCRKPTALGYKPFCSAACRDRDLLQWLGDGYALPVPPNELEDRED